ncbi:hypothetical protein LC593_10535 [Nostoc sp. CHAB 5844]|nr:hypothetical protein [Nostoc sp. CHAB 5844]
MKSLSEDRDDKNNLSYTFIPPVNYTPEQIKTGQELVEILNDPNKSEANKRDEVWEILNNQGT